MVFKESKRKIYITKDYDAFVFPDWNRDVSNGRVVKMVESIQKVGWLPEPVLINDKFEVIDGQSRVKALQKLGMPVEFCIVQGIGRKECQMLNLFQKNWTTKNYIDSYIADGNKNYIWLRDMLVKYKSLTPFVVIGVAIGKGQKRTMSGASNDIISEGRLSLTDTEKARADESMFYLSRFADTANYLGGRKDTFYSALLFMYNLDGIDQERLCQVVNNARYDGLVASGTVEGWLMQIESIYNKGLRKANKVDVVHEYKVA